MDRKRTIDPQIGQRLREYRKHRGMTVREFAEAAHLTAGAISRFENGRRRISADRIIQFARILHCEPNDLYRAPGSPLRKRARFAVARQRLREYREHFAVARQRLREYREHRGMTVRQLAEAIHMSPGTISDYEHGRMRIPSDRLTQLSRILAIKPGDLLQPFGWPLRRNRVRSRVIELMAAMIAEAAALVSSRRKVAAAADNEMLALSTAVAVAVSASAAAASDASGEKISSLTSGDDAAVDTSGVSWSSAAPDWRHRMAGTVTNNERVEGNLEIAGLAVPEMRTFKADEMRTFKADAEATLQIDAADAANAPIMDAHADPIHVPDHHTIELPAQSRGDKLDRRPVSATSEEKEEKSAKTEFIASKPPSDNGHDSAFQFKPNFDHPAKIGDVAKAKDQPAQSENFKFKFADDDEGHATGKDKSSVAKIKDDTTGKDVAAVTEDTNTAAQPNPVTGNLLSNDTDVDSTDTHTVSALSGGTDNGTTLTKVGAYGTLVITKATGAYTYTLANGQANVQALADGQQVTDVFTHTDSDNHGGSSTSTLTVTVTGSNDAPVAMADVAALTEDAQPNPVTGNLLSNDTDVDSTDTHTVSALDGGTDDGTTLTKVGTYGTLVITKATGAYTYTLANGQANMQALADGQQVADVFTYTNADNNGGSSTSTLTVTVTGTNDAPIAMADVAALTEDAQPNTVSGNLLSNDTDVDSTDTHTVSALDGGTDDGTTITKVGIYGTLVITKATGAYTYTLANGQANVQALADGQQVTDVFTYTNADNHGGSSTSTLTVTVTGTNEAPVAVADTAAVTEDAQPNPVTGNLLTNDTDVDSGDTHTISALSGGTDDGTTLTKVGPYGTLVIIKATGAYTYTLANGQANVQTLADGQQVTDVFTYTDSKDKLADNDHHASADPESSNSAVNDGGLLPVTDAQPDNFKLADEGNPGKASHDLHAKEIGDNTKAVKDHPAHPLSENFKFKFADDDEGHATGKDKSSVAKIKDDTTGKDKLADNDHHASADPESSNSAVNDGGLLPVTDAQPDNFKLADEGNPGKASHDLHAKEIGDNTKAVKDHPAHPHSENFKFKFADDAHPGNNKLDMIETDRTVTADIRLLLHTAQDANAVNALDANHTTAAQDMTKVPHHHGDFLT
jgi:VCBS repeat-containing protein